MTLVAVVGTLGGAVLGQVADLWKTERLRKEEARVKARELAWNQSTDAFQRLFGIRIRLRADLVTYREATVRAAYYAAIYHRTGASQDAECELHYRRMVTEYTSRIIDDRSQLHAVLGWFEYILPAENHPLHKPASDLMNLSYWYTPRPPQARNELDKWADTTIEAATTDARKEVDEKFGAVMAVLNSHRDELLHEPAARYLRQLSE